MIDVVNLQRKIKVDLPSCRVFTQTLISAIPETAERTFSVAFIGDSRMKQLNEMFRQKDSTTDVLSFPHEPDPFESKSYAFTRDNQTPKAKHTFLGDIVISAEQAQKQAAENGLTLDIEIKQLILHGLLHLCGYDHETDNGEMDARELELRKALGI